MKHLLLFLSTCYIASCLPPPHPAVVQVRFEEDQLPSHLRSPALKNPHLRQVLPLSSLLHHGEKFVHHREADNVDRREIYNILTHAGFIPRRLFQRPSQQHYVLNHHHQLNFLNPPPLTNPEILQHFSEMPHTCSSLIKDYCAHCTFAGVHFIADDTKHWVERVVWAIQVFLAWCGVSLLIIAAWDSFVENPISFGVETTYLDWETKLPAVAVCELENRDKVYEVADTIWPPGHLLDLEDALKEIAYFRGKSYSLVENCHDAKVPNALCPMGNYTYYANLIRSDCPKIIRGCSYNGIEFDCCDYFQLIYTEFGQCFILNSIQTKDPKPYEMVCNRTQKEGIIKFDILITAMIYTLGEDEVPCIATLQSSTLKIQPNHAYRRILTVRNIENDPLVASETSIEQRACRSNAENADGLYPHYSYSACMVKCRKLGQMDACGCNDHFMLGTKEEELCNITGMACLHLRATQLTTFKPKWATRPGLTCNCLPSCSETEISVIKDVDRKNRTLKKKAEVEILLAYLPTERIKRRVVRSRLDFVVSVGGTTGLFVGASILSFVELFFYFTVRLANNIWMDRRNRVKKKKNVKPLKRKRVNVDAIKVIRHSQIQGPYADSGVFHSKLVACDHIEKRGYGPQY